MNTQQQKTCRERGFTLIEALVVVAIIGMISLVTVPNFISYLRAGRIKSSVRYFTSDIREARSIAVSTQGCAMVSFLPGTTTDDSRAYAVFQGERQADGTCDSWTLYKTKNLEQTVYFLSTDFDDDEDEPDEHASGTNDIVFKANGSLVVDPLGTRELVMKTTSEVPINQFRIKVYPSGTLKAKDF